MGRKSKKGSSGRKGGFRVCEVGKSSRVAVPWGQCSKNTWVAKVVSSEACFIAKLFLNPAGERQHTSGFCSEGALRGTRAPERQLISRKLTCARGAQLLPAAVPAGLHPHAKEEERSLPQRPPWDPTVISVPCLYSISPTSPIYPWAFSFSHPIGHSPILSSAFSSLEPLTS